MNALHFDEARELVVREVSRAAAPPLEQVPLHEAAGRILAEPVLADRDIPALNRSLRDGYAVRSADLPGTLRVIGEVRAGGAALQPLQTGEAIEIMTGAPVPPGADQIVMVEHGERATGTGISTVSTDRTRHSGEWILPQGTEARKGEMLLAPGARIDFATIAMLAAVGAHTVPVSRRVHVAVVPTGDELVPVEWQPQPHEIRDSNSHAVAAQVLAAGALPKQFPPTADDRPALRRTIEAAFDNDLVLFSGGVSAGRYDLVEPVLAEMGAEFLFTKVLIQPGSPLVFGRVQGKFFFGLPGNPASTMTTFALFARAAIDLLGGATHSYLPLAWARLTESYRHSPGLTRFLPARVEGLLPTLTPIRWSGSSDMRALARANCWMVVDHDRAAWGEGDVMRVLFR